MYIYTCTRVSHTKCLHGGFSSADEINIEYRLHLHCLFQDIKECLSINVTQRKFELKTHFQSLFWPALPSTVTKIVPV